MTTLAIGSGPTQASVEVRSSSGFTWLHFSDIHVGMGMQSRLWPRFGTKLIEDLSYLLKRIQKIDLVVFSGDLVQKGLKDEFNQFNAIVNEVLLHVASVTGIRPQLVTVPGNHDLVRPQALDSQAMALEDYWLKDALQEGFWEDAGKEYRQFIAGIFANYEAWREQSIEEGVHVKPDIIGMLPGDASYSITTQNGTLGVVGLNSAWLQLSDANYEGRLHVDVLQLMAVTQGQPDQWARKNSANLLVTHHPASWLKDKGIATWRGDINPDGRFDLHLFGHMHEPMTLSTAHGGGVARHDIQAASLFGLEKFGDGFLRIQGYSANSIEVTEDGRTFTSWPRRLEEQSGGDRKLVPDAKQNLDEDSSSFTIDYALEPKRVVRLASIGRNEATLSFDLTPIKPFDLELIRKDIAQEKAHLRVRRVEQETFIDAMRKQRVAWLASDWGMGDEGFIGAVEGKLAAKPNIFSISFGDYKSRDSFLDELRERLGATFHQICERIAGAGPSILILEDVDLSRWGGRELAYQADLEGLAQTVADFAPETFVVLKGRPLVSRYKVVELNALDEADLATYVRDSERGDEKYAKPDVVSKLHRHTDGIPHNIDTTLRELKVVSVEELTPSNPDLAQVGSNLVNAPQALVAAVYELQSSQDRGEQRALQLLLALAALPHGEQMSRMKRFLGVNPFMPVHARELLERSLIEARALASTERAASESTNKTLVVPKPVRDYIRETTKLEEARQIDRRALGLYFGESWSQGEIATSPIAKRVSEALCENYEIQNANTLIFRAVSQALKDRSKFEIDGAIRLGLAFIRALINGDHFRTACDLCHDMLGLLEEEHGYIKELNRIRFEYAESLRMAGRTSEAIEVFKVLDLSGFSKADRQSADLDLALCYEKLGRTDEAKEVAKRIIDTNSKSGLALQAQSILVGLIDDDAERVAELEKVLVTAQKQKRCTVANNVRLQLATEHKDDVKLSKKLYREVLKDAPSTEFYTRARAIVNLAKLPDAPTWMNFEERALLVDAYYYLYNERLFSFFDQSHAALWKMFEHDNDRPNLLKLFRYSSFIWRLAGREQQEIKYLRKLSSNVAKLATVGVSTIDRDGAYLIVRIAVVLGEGAEQGHA